MDGHDDGLTDDASGLTAQDRIVWKAFVKRATATGGHDPQQ